MDSAWQAWSGPVCTRLARVLVTLALALLFLQAAATVQVVFTIQISYALLAVACVVGAPHILVGWGRLPSWLRWMAAGLVLSYLLALGTGHTMTLATQARASSYRGLAYIADLLLGLSIVGLVAGLLSERRDLRMLVWVLAAGGAAAALYGIYQWLAIRYHLPLQNIDNAVNTNGVTSGGTQSQGAGPLGGQRIRSTFVEPHFLAAYLALMVPLALASHPPARWRRLVLPAVAVMAFALVLAASVPGVAVLAAAALVGMTLRWVSLGRVRLSAVGGGVLVLGVVLIAAVLVYPSSLTSVTGRTATQLRETTGFRTDSWSQALDLWASRPVTGFGPGQGSVQLATPETVAGKTYDVLGTANGIWAAALLDGGVLAFSAWLLTLGGLLLVGAQAVLRRADTLVLGIFVAATAAVLASLDQGDRLDLQVWVLLGLLAAASRMGRAQGGEDHGKADQSPDPRPAHGTPRI
jgi:O-Antigen ligase